MIEPMTGKEGKILSAVSYNIHQCVGRDGIVDPGRIAGILRYLDPDAVALQEVDNRYGSDLPAQLNFLAGATGMEPVAGPTLVHDDGNYGNALLSRHEIKTVRRIDLSFRCREPRGALDVELDIDGRPVRIIATHLGLVPAERRFQARKLVQFVSESPVRPLLLMGDLNEWLTFGRPARWLHRHFGQAPALATYPSFFPLVALDRILVQPESALMECRVIDLPETRMASDHLPLQARVKMP